MILWGYQQELFIPQVRSKALHVQWRLREVRNPASSHTASEPQSQAHGGLSPAAQPESVTPVPVDGACHYRISHHPKEMSSPLITDFITHETAGLGRRKIA